MVFLESLNKHPNLKSYLILLCIILFSIPVFHLIYLQRVPFGIRYLTFINYFDQTVHVKIENFELELEPNTSGIVPFLQQKYSADIVITDLNNNILDKKDVFVGRTTGYTIDLLSENRNIQKCFVSININNVFYISGLVQLLDDNDYQPTATEQYMRQVSALKNMRLDYVIYNSNPSDSMYFKNQSNFNKILFPGEYNGDKLPPTLSGSTDNVYSIIPIDCSDINKIRLIRQELLKFMFPDYHE